MKVFAGLTAALAGFATALPPPAQTDSKGLEVSLELVDDTNVKATVKNNGQEQLRILKTASILGQAQTDKVHVEGQDGTPDFTGGLVNVLYDKLQSESFITVAPGESVDSTFDVAKIYDLSKGGEFTFTGRGVLHIGDGDNKIVREASFETNTLKSHVDGAKAAKIQSTLSLDHLTKRTSTDGSCQGSRLETLQRAYNIAHTKSTSAAYYARQGPADRLNEYFKGSDQGTRDHVAGVFDRVAASTYTLASGSNKAFCRDPRAGCADGSAAAVTYVGTGEIAYCNFFFDSSSDINQDCHSQDRSEIVIHETTHTRKVAGTADNAYFYDGIVKLNHQQALNNADTYGLYASSFWTHCYGGNIARVFTCTDINFQGKCVGIYMPVGGFCSNIPNFINDKISSLGGAYQGKCYGYVDTNCQGNALEIPNGHDAQLNSLPNGWNDVFSSFKCYQG